MLAGTGVAEGEGPSAIATEDAGRSTDDEAVQALPARIRATATTACFITMSRPDFRAEGSNPRGTMVYLRR
jgi:hypothetical protein